MGPLFGSTGAHTYPKSGQVSRAVQLSLSISTPAVVMAQRENSALLICGLPILNHWAVIRFSLKVSFNNVFSKPKNISDATVWSSFHALHQSFRAQTMVLLPLTSSPGVHCATERG